MSRRSGFLIVSLLFLLAAVTRAPAVDLIQGKDGAFKEFGRSSLTRET